MSSRATPGPAAKRRRIELANATLRRPFRSPMIKNRSTSGDIKSTLLATRLRKGPAEPREAVGGTGGGVAADITEGETEKEDDDDDDDANTSFETSFSSVTMPKELRKAPTRSAISRKRSSLLGLGSTPTVVTSITPKKRPSLVGQNHTTKVRTTVAGEAQGPDCEGDDDILAKLQRTHRATKILVIAMQKQLDLIRQAKRIEMASRKKIVGEEGGKERSRRHEDATAAMVIDAELKELVQKWKLASRQAAEDLFELIKGRVANMGGAKAWRETKRRQMEGFQSAWEDEDRPQGGKKRKGDNDEQEIADSDAASDDDNFDDDGGLSSPQEAGNEDDEQSAADDCEDSGFTVLMMLQSLNIEPDVLGYDPNEDKWLD